MPQDKLRAWLVSCDVQRVLAAFVAICGETGTPNRRFPAVRLFRSAEEGRTWIDGQARAFAVDVEWMQGAPPQLSEVHHPGPGGDI